MNKLSVIATLNHHLLDSKTLQAMAENGATIFRLNGAHLQPSEVSVYAKKVRATLGKKVKLLVDLPGNKIRTSVLTQPIVLNAGKTFELRKDQVNYAGFISHLVVGDTLVANDSLFKFEVKDVTPDHAVLLSATDGTLTSNKGIHLNGKTLDLPFLFERDRELIREAIQNEFEYVGFSFVRKAEEVKEASQILAGTGTRMIIKVETAPALENLEGILDNAEEFLVDRGDLGCDVGIENIDRLQKYILKRAKQKGKTVYFATQFLHSMLHNNVPLISEACGLSDALNCGIDGLQLSEETAIGKNPIEVLKTVQRFKQAAHDAIVRKDITSGTVLWLTGRSGAGKTTVSHQLKADLEKSGYTACLIDGDEFRAFFGNTAGYTKDDRIRNQQNIAYCAHQSAEAFDVVIVSSLSPYRVMRDFARSKIANFHEVFVECSQTTCQKRDPKGNYAKALSGEMKNYIGVTEDYEPPEKPELTVNTEKLSVVESSRKIMTHLIGAT